MKLPKLVRLFALSLIVAATASLPADAARRCGCDYCQSVDPTAPCNLQGDSTTCGAFLAVALCPVN